METICFQFIVNKGFRLFKMFIKCEHVIVFFEGIVTGNKNKEISERDVSLDVDVYTYTKTMDALFATRIWNCLIKSDKLKV